MKMEWQPIETAPKDDGHVHVRGLWVHSSVSGDRIYFDAVAGYLDDGDFLACDGEDPGWRPDDYTHWMPLPPPPVGAA